MATLVAQSIVETGLNPVLVAADVAGDEFLIDSQERTMFVVDNAGGGVLIATVEAQNTSVKVPGFGTTVRGDMVVTVPAGEQRYVGPFPNAFADPADGNRVQVAYDGVTSVTVGVFKLPKS
jgi:hypothetical protein